MRSARVTSLLGCLLLVAQLQAASWKSVKPIGNRIDAALSNPELKRGFWGIEVVSQKTGKVLYAQNSERLFTPASNTKLFTTAAVLASIGPDYRFHTTLESNGVLDKHGRLTG